MKKIFLRFLQNLWENTCARVSFIIKFEMITKDSLTQVFSCEFCKSFKNTFLYRTPLVAASVIDLSVIHSEAVHNKTVYLSHLRRITFLSSALYPCINKSFPGPSIILLLILYLDCCLHISVNNEKKSKTKQSKKNISQNKHIIPYRARTALFPKSEFFFKFYVNHYLLNCLTFSIIINNFK